MGIGNTSVTQSQMDYCVPKEEVENPVTGVTDNLMEGIYLRTEAEGQVMGRAKLVRPEFVEKIKQSEHWQHQKMIPNLLVDGADIWK